MSELLDNEIKVDIIAKHDQQSFMMVRPTNSFYKVGEKYIFVNKSNNAWHSAKYLVSKKTIVLQNITDEISFLDKNVTPRIYDEICRKIYGMRKFDSLDVMTFTDKVCYRPFLKD